MVCNILFWGSDVPDISPYITTGEALKTCGVRGKHVSKALQLGYRLLDTAQAFRWGYTEDEVMTVGLAVKESRVPRSKIWIQTKLDPQFLGTSNTNEAIHMSMKNLQVDYIDSMIIHFPVCHNCPQKVQGTWEDSWRVLEEFYSKGIIKAIGVSNFDLPLLQRLYKMASIKPMILQNWMDPFHQDTEIRRWCKEHQLIYQAYSQFGTQWRHMRDGIDQLPVLTNPVLARIAAKRGVSAFQIVVRWAIEDGVGVIPASTKAHHQQSNLDALSLRLSEEDMAEIRTLNGLQPGREKDTSRIELAIRNKSGDKALLFWVGPEEIVPQGELDASSVQHIHTYAGHVFEAKFVGSSRTVMRFRVSPEPQHQEFLIDEVTMEESRKDEL
eukprot:jgi/Bigna1/84848/estExt_fgenesh1_pg.C_10203